jgi:RNA methyltransferase, TrmH family
MIITSVQNPRLKAAAKLRARGGRDEQGRIIIDGVREIRRALAGGVEIVEVYYVPELCEDEKYERMLETLSRAGAALVQVTPHVMEKLAFGQRVEGLVSIARNPKKTLEEIDVSGDELIAIVEGAEKPGNIGAIIRTADAAGVTAVVVVDGGTDLYNPNAIRSSLGAIFSLPVCAASGDEAIAWLRGHKFNLLAARVEAATDYTAADLRGRTAIALGSEAHGLSERWRADDVTAIRLPMLGTVDSLNLSATAAVLFYEALRQRRWQAT